MRDVKTTPREQYLNTIFAEALREWLGLKPLYRMATNAPGMTFAERRKANQQRYYARHRVK